MHGNPSPHFLPRPCSRMLLLSITAHKEDTRQRHSWGHQSLDGKLGLKGPPTASLYFHPGFLPSSSPLLRARPTPAFQLCPRFLCVSSCKGTNSTMGVAPSSLNFLPRPYIQIQSRWRLGLPPMSVGGSQTFSPYQLPTKNLCYHNIISKLTIN